MAEEVGDPECWVPCALHNLLLCHWSKSQSNIFTSVRQLLILYDGALENVICPDRSVQWQTLRRSCVSVSTPDSALTSTALSTSTW